MDWTANVAVHESASPLFIREQIVAALQDGRLHPSLLYSGLRQTSLWIALYKAFSPAQQDPRCASLYETAFMRAVGEARGNVQHVVSLACGDGSKDVRCLQAVRASERTGIYTPADISLEMVLTAARSAQSRIPGLQTTPLLCDLPNCSVLPAILKGFDPSGAERLLLFLGTIHNYWPPEILRSILYPLRTQDQLLIGANLAPEANYDAAMGDILAQYDNEPTRRWLMGALSELGIGEADGALHFGIRETALPGLKRIDARFRIERTRRVRIYESELELRSGKELSVFYSHRFTAAHMHAFLEGAGLSVRESWIGASGFEGLFLCRRSAG
jgi:uncharacterized SAM-dependent methyltransferase